MKRFLLALSLMSVSAFGADVNITNIAHAGSVATTDYLLGNVGATGPARLFPVSLFPILSGSQIGATYMPALTGDITTSAGSVATTLKTSPTIVTPTIASFVNATHNHQNAAGGGTLDGAAIASGSIADARLSANVALLNRNGQTFSGNNEFQAAAQFDSTTTFLGGMSITSNLLVGSTASVNSTNQVQFMDRSGNLGFEMNTNSAIYIRGPFNVTGGSGPGVITLLEGTAPANPAATYNEIYVDSTSHQVSAKPSGGTVSVMVTPDTGAANNFLTAISSAGVISKARPSFSDLSGGSVTQINYTTNSGSSVAPDFNLGYMLLSTNAAFTFLAPVNVDSGKTQVQTCVYFVTNTTAAAVLVTAPANCHPSGTMYVTNLTCFSFSQYGNKFTNVVALPLY